MSRTEAVLPGGPRLSDYLSIGVLAQVYPIAAVREALASCGRESRRQRALPWWRWARGRRLPWRAGGYDESEDAQVEALLPRLSEGMLVLAGRGYCSFPLWQPGRPIRAPTCSGA